VLFSVVLLPPIAVGDIALLICIFGNDVTPVEFLGDIVFEIGFKASY
jgi:hypothetical protein